MLIRPCLPIPGSTGLPAGFALPEQPDRAWVDGWLHRSYQDFWAL